MPPSTLRRDFHAELIPNEVCKLPNENLTRVYYTSLEARFLTKFLYDNAMNYHGARFGDLVSSANPPSVLIFC